MLFLFQFILAVSIFYALNWVGRHSSHLGYETPSLFDSANGSVALNFIIRAFAPTVLMIIVASIVIKIGYTYLTINIYHAVVIYFAIRVGYIIIWGRSRIVSWPKIVFQCVAGIYTAFWAYESLIVPRTPLFPDLNTIGNELWLAIAAFLYAMINGLESPSEPSTKRTNSYIRISFQNISAKYGDLITNKMRDNSLELIFFSILIVENYNRPKAVRFVERFWPANKSKTLGIAQVRSATPISDRQSVEMARDRINSTYDELVKHGADQEGKWQLTRSLIIAYNQDETYAGNVFDIMDTLAARVAPQYKPVYDGLWDE